MTDDKWEQLVENIRGQFKNVAMSTQPLIVQTADGSKEQGTEDILTFDGPGARFKIVRENRPVILEKKEHYSHRAGDTARTEYIVSETEFSHKLKVYKENDDYEWQEIGADSLGL